MACARFDRRGILAARTHLDCDGAVRCGARCGVTRRFDLAFDDEVMRRFAVDLWGAQCQRRAAVDHRLSLGDLDRYIIREIFGLRLTLGDDRRDRFTDKSH